MQGALASLAGIIAPPMTTGLFGYFISPQAPMHLPGVAFFLGAALMFGAMLLAWRSFKKPTPVAVA